MSEVFGAERAGDLAESAGFWELRAEVGTDGCNFGTTAQEGIGTAGGDVSSSDDEYGFSEQVDHQREVWRAREKFILSGIMCIFIFSQGVRKFETGI